MEEGMQNVFFMDMRSSPKESLLQKFKRLLETAGVPEKMGRGQLLAIKLHFGEKGNSAFIRPIFIRQLVELALERKALPFLTDTNTLYSGSRSDSVSHLRTAIENGFAYSVVEAPIIIADGLRGSSYQKVAISGELIKEAYVAKEIYDADFLLSIAHFKGHELAGFGGAIKNVGMGCAARKGKLEQHSDLSPKVKAKKCIGCGMCAEHCSQKAISLVEKKAQIDQNLCIGCGECIIICPNKAIEIQWSSDIPRFLKKMVEYSKAVLSNKKDKAFFVNFLTNISPACDCYGHSDMAICQDVGVLASWDPVAIDKASADLVNRMPLPMGHFLCDKEGAEKDKFRALYPNVDWQFQLKYAEEIGLGTRDYQLVPLGEPA